MTTTDSWLDAVEEIQLDQTMVPPHDLEAEGFVLGSVLKKPVVLGRLLELSPEDFYDPKHAAIWRGMLDLAKRNVPLDVKLLLDKLAIGRVKVSAAELMSIDFIGPQAEYVEHYAKIVSDTATQRRYIDAAQNLATMAWRRGIDLSELATKAEASITAARPKTRGLRMTPEQWAQAVEIDMEARATGQRTAVLTGLRDVDQMTLGLEAGGLYLLMGTPGTGKTELALQTAMNVAEHYGPVVFASLEMSEVELGHRFARISQGLHRNQLAKGTLSDDESGKFLSALNLLAVGRLWPLAPTSAIYTTQDLRSDCLDIQAQSGKLALIVADYVQRFDDGDRNPAHREINVGMVAKSLKSLAREFGCPVLAPVQPNRAFEARPDKRPLLTDLRESGKLEQEADVVLAIFRAEKVSHDPDPHDLGVAEIHMLKNRSGVGDERGSRKLRWIGHKYGNYTADFLP